MAKKARLKNKSGAALYPETLSGLVNRPGGGTVEEALAALGNGEALRPLYIARGAVYNEETGFYELNGLTDITEEEMLAIFAHTAMYGYGGQNVFSRFIGYYDKVRTNFPPLGYGIRMEMLFPFGESTSFETLNLMPLFEYRRSGLESLKYPMGVHNGYSTVLTTCRKLRRVYGTIQLNTSFGGSICDTCDELTDVRVKELSTSIRFCTGSPSLSLESVSYLVENATNTSAITVTVHPDVLAKLQDAEGHPDWYAVNTAAQGKQISFATTE